MQTSGIGTEQFNEQMQMTDGQQIRLMNLPELCLRCMQRQQVVQQMEEKRQ